MTYSDPAIGIPCLYVGAIDRYWHTCQDTIDKVDPHILHLVTAMSATWAYFIAAAGTTEALWMAELSASDGAAEIALTGASLAGEVLAAGEAAGAAKIVASAAEKLDYTAWWRTNEVFSVKGLVPKGDDRNARKALNSLRKYLRSAAKREATRIGKLARATCGKLPESEPAEKSPKLSEAERLVPVRKFFGSLTFDSIPPSVREGRASPRWDSVANGAVFWSDGKRTLAEVIRLTRLETGRGGEELVDLFRFLEKHGLVELKPAGD